jgi:phosphate starvation-inducible PhoH-like protein
MGKKGRREKFSPCSFESEIYMEEYEIEPSAVPKNDHQKDYNRVLYGMKPMVFAIGPAGTGKTMLACYAAIQGLNDDSYKKIILTRPAVSVEEDIGYLPGTLEEKMDPWTRPIMDIFAEFYDQSQIASMIKDKIIEICPLAYMRGRTFKNAFIIADEMQNSTSNQMKMLLTRMGDNSKMVITGDLMQHDRKYDDNGLRDIYERIKDKIYKRIECVTFEHGDIERSEIVKDILEIYGD